MADTDPFIKPQTLGSQVPQNHTDTSKYFTDFLYKAVIVTIFLVVLPLLTSQAPEFVNHTLHTRSWELLQLVFVGIAVSYGLFSRRNEETEKEHSSKFDNAQSYVSRFLQVSSVFDDEAENPSEFDDNKVQTWNSQYYRGEPVVVVARENSVLEEQRSTSSITGEKPLLLPVRSLKSRISESDVVESINESSAKTGSLSRSSSNLGSKRFSNSFTKTRNGEFGCSNPLNSEEKVEENVVLPSPIPWRSRSGRMEMKEDLDVPPLYSLPPSMEESEFNRLESRSFRSQTSLSSRPNSTSPSPNKLSPSPSLSSPKKPSPLPPLSPELHAKSVEDTVRKKIHYKSSPPPPPPPPPPPFYSPMKSNSNLRNDYVFAEKELKRSIRSVSKDTNGSGREEVLMRTNSGLESRPRTQNYGSLMGQPVRTIRSNEPVMGAMNGMAEKRETESGFIERTRRTFPVMSKSTSSVYRMEEMNGIEENVVVESDEDSETESDDFGGSSEYEEVASNNGGPDVNKKADEFIAKFREQIRLQRIDSIKRSTGQLPRKSK
ncbi:uncharacterized protein LOC132284120 [Cornus florida]|uniref:uncharacterized protein LOC132284120 n=1 Tax=Cornus florida TaxID=4283 RepID=UPI00289CAABC|nr:uncharacterized protein LOC132284120 [Cornus florida]